VPPVPYDQARLPSPEQLDELFKERRSLRFFEKEKVDRWLLETIVGYGIYSPTNNFALRAIIVDDEGIIAELDRVVMEYIVRMYNLFYRPKIVSTLASLIRLSRAYLLAKPKLKNALERGHALLSPPAAFVFIVGDRRVPLSEVSAQCALSNMIFYAQANGIGSCLWGNGQLLCDRNQAVRRRLGLQRREHILGSMMLGYPAVKYANKVEGKTLPIQWNSE
jgi:nitroreductase